MSGSVAVNSVPPVTLPPASILIFTGFHSLEPAGGSPDLPKFQVLSSNLPWLRAPGGALSMAWLSSPALAASGYFAWRAATSSSLAWPNAANAQRPTSAAIAAEYIKRFMKIPPLRIAICARFGRDMTAHRQKGQTRRSRTSLLLYGFVGTRFVVSPSKENPMKIIRAAALLALTLLTVPAQAAITSQSWGALEGKGV